MKKGIPFPWVWGPLNASLIEQKWQNPYTSVLAQNKTGFKDFKPLREKLNKSRNE